jgi:DNA-binding transcriptional LysR family regulator
VTMLGMARTAEDEMRALAGLDSGLVRVGAFLSACASFVPAALGTFVLKHPAIEVKLEQQEPPASLPRVLAGELDLAVIWHQHTNSADPDPRLDSVLVGVDPYSVVLPPEHRLARRRELRLADLRGERFSSPRPVAGGLQYRAMLERLCAEEGFIPDFAYVVDDTTVARAFAACGLCVGVMPEMTVPHPRPDVVVKPLRGMHPFRTVHVTWLRGRRAPGVAEMVRALTQSAEAMFGPVA